MRQMYSNKYIATRDVISLLNADVMLLRVKRGSLGHLVGQLLEPGYLPGFLLRQLGAQVPDGERTVHVAHGQQARVGGVEGQTRGRFAPCAAMVQGGGGPRRSPAQVEDLHHTWRWRLQ